MVSSTATVHKFSGSQTSCSSSVEAQWRGRWATRLCESSRDWYCKRTNTWPASNKEWLHMKSISRSRHPSNLMLTREKVRALWLQDIESRKASSTISGSSSTLTQSERPRLTKTICRRMRSNSWDSLTNLHSNLIKIRQGIETMRLWKLIPLLPEDTTVAIPQTRGCQIQTSNSK